MESLTNVRLYIVDVHRSGAAMHHSNIIYADIVAMFNIPAINLGWKDIFTEPIDYDIVDGTFPHCKSASLPDVIKWLEETQEQDFHRAIPSVIEYLKTVNTSHYEDLQIVCYEL